MKEKELKKFAYFCIGYMIVVGVCGWILNNYYNIQITSAMCTKTNLEVETVSKCIQRIVACASREIQKKEEDIIQIENTEDIQKKLGSHYIKIKKNKNRIENIMLKDEYEEQKICIYFNESNEQQEKPELNKSAVSWVADGKEYFYDEKETEHTGTVQSITVQEELKQNTKEDCFFGNMEDVEKTDVFQRQNCFIELKLNKIYAYQLYEDMDNIYVNLQSLREAYDTIVVVDAGHGGEDTGSYAAFGEESEKDFNLAIVKRLKKQLDQLSAEKRIKVYYTRLTDKRTSLEKRVLLANSVGADLFLSVHCNSNEETPEANGVEVLYHNSDEIGNKSKEFAKIILNELVERTGRRKRSILKGNNIYIVRNVQMPVVLAEVGFLNNNSDLYYIKSEAGQKSIAEALYEGILKMLQSNIR